MPKQVSPLSTSSPRLSSGRKACDACRASKTKCDRLPCCSRCQSKHLDCHYTKDSDSSTPKSALREEVQRRKERLEEANTILEALRSTAAPSTPQGGPNDAAITIIEGLRRGDSHESIVKRINNIEENDMALGSPTSQGSAAPAPNPYPMAMEIDSSSAPWTQPLSASKNTSTIRVLDGSTDSSGTPRSQPTQCSASSTDSPYYTSPFNPQSPTTLSSVAVAGGSKHQAPGGQPSSTALDSWTSSGMSKSHILGLITSVLDWECVPLCLIRTELFLQDLKSGDRRYCSPALVSALLALALAIKPDKIQHTQDDDDDDDNDDNDNDDDDDDEDEDEDEDEDGNDNNDNPLQDGDSALMATNGETLWKESRTQLRTGGPVLHALPDSQAIGVLALYEASVGQDDAALARLLDEFAVAMANLSFGDHDRVPDGDEYSQVCAMTYRGAVTLRRIHQLTGVTSVSRNLMEAHQVPFFEMSKSSSNVAELADRFSSHSPGANHVERQHRNYPHYLTSGMFQLTASLQRLQHISEPPPSARLQLYFKCLEWYNGFFAVQSWHHTDSDSSGLHGHRPEADENRNRDLSFETFTHMFYHFSILQTLGPLASDPHFAVGSLRAYDICRDAANSILAFSFSAGASPVFNEGGRQRSCRLTFQFISAAESFLGRPPL